MSTIITQSQEVLVVEASEPTGVLTLVETEVLVVEDTEVTILEAVEQGMAGPPGGWLGGAELAYRKNPAASLDYVFDWTRYLSSWGTYLPSDTIASVVWTVSAGITQGATSFTSKTATIFVSGGTAGNMETITCRITTSGGRIDERTISLQITNF